MAVRLAPAAVLLSAVSLAGAASACGEKSEPTGTGAAETAPTPPAREPVSRQVLGQKRSPAGAAGRTLGLWRVEVQPGARIPLHRHPGTQVAYVLEGRLTFTVVRGSVEVMRASGDGFAPVRRISAGRTATLAPGQWIVEESDVVHRAFNGTQARVVILLANLLDSRRQPTIPLAQPGD
jgi:quercetin dioxygenase-like cupin family protein